MHKTTLKEMLHYLKMKFDRSVYIRKSVNIEPMLIPVFLHGATYLASPPDTMDQHIVYFIPPFFYHWRGDGVA